MNTLYYGDNLDVLRQHVAKESVDLIYLDPPFNSNRSYNVLFKAHSGEASQAQIEAFDDTWHWSPQTEAQYAALLAGGPPTEDADSDPALHSGCSQAWV
jgi:adenine specific DNA methylase Mod